MRDMKTQTQNVYGFTLLELMVSMALGLIVMAAMASLFKTGLNSTMLVTQRAETQQNMRAAIDLMAKDISMAGAGLPSGGIQLPAGAGSTVSKYGCDQGGTCHLVNFNYPNGNYMYGIIPGFSNGVEGGAVIPAAPAPAVNDSITVVYADYNFPLWEYTVTFVAGTNGGQITLAASAGFTPPAINSAGTEVGEVTGLTATSISFANLDPLNVNQSGAATNNLKSISGGASTVAYRLFAVTYYLTVPGAGQTPRLMRQVNGLTPVPVADDIINLQFAYDAYNGAATPATLDANQPNPLGVAENPNTIQKINIVVMGQSIISNGNKSQSMYLGTSVSARNMAFSDRYK